MGEKKSKALADNLMDDLLSDDRTHKSDSLGESSSSQEPAPIDESSRTMRTPIDAEPPPPAVVREKKATDGNDKMRASVGRLATFRSSGAGSATETALAQSESLRIAQARLFELEHEIERLRLQNESLAAAAETLRRVGDEMSSENEHLKAQAVNLKAEADQEKRLFSESKESIQKNLEVLRSKNEELEIRVSTNVQKIRVRERELENRLELVKMESAAIIGSKDEMLLDLKRQVDQLNVELGNYRTKNQELMRTSNEKQEVLRRTVKTLRLALSMLEGDAPMGEGLKKAK